MKNIYVEHELNNALESNNMTKVSSITCNGFFNIDCQLKDMFFEKSIEDTNYTIKVQQANLLNFHIFQKKNRINDFELRIKNMTLSDSRDAFLELEKPMDLNLTLLNEDKESKLIVNLSNLLLFIKVKIIFENNDTFRPQHFSSIDVEVKRKNDVIKKIIYEIYKIKLLEIIGNDDKEFSTTRGINIPLGIDSSKVIALEVFLGEPYESMSILLNSEIETFDWVDKYSTNDNISSFISDIIKENGVSKLQINQKKEN